MRRIRMGAFRELGEVETGRGVVDDSSVNTSPRAAAIPCGASEACVRETCLSTNNRTDIGGAVGQGQRGRPAAGEAYPCRPALPSRSLQQFAVLWPRTRASRPLHAPEARACVS
jgi:hypothetical protein